ncbi:hypothetical protein RRG08_058946 [Elysia crispata]|uniref:Uncharacterized protein n=1 Tax=Elysia crispata TaxID=231223 RepID=A0AAE1CLD4_9GAST|nr:hypothetical protein RRG08_058946 [Elysia crispata]
MTSNCENVRKNQLSYDSLKNPDFVPYNDEYSDELEHNHVPQSQERDVSNEQNSQRADNGAAITTNVQHFRDRSSFTVDSDSLESLNLRYS